MIRRIRLEVMKVRGKTVVRYRPTRTVEVNGVRVEKLGDVEGVHDRETRVGRLDSKEFILVKLGVLQRLWRWLGK